VLDDCGDAVEAGLLLVGAPVLTSPSSLQLAASNAIVIAAMTTIGAR
jgi:hypothetical protein